jgi:hypothetical protein
MIPNQECHREAILSHPSIVSTQSTLQLSWTSGDKQNLLFFPGLALSCYAFNLLIV